LVTGPISRDEHWHLVDRLTPLGIKATTEPLTFHATAFSDNIGLSAAVSMILLSFDQQRQQLLEFLHFEDGAAVKNFPLGHGQLFWAAYPIELSETSQP